MANYKQKINPRTGQFNLVNDDGILFFKASVATVGDLPTEGNTKNDTRIADDTHHMYVWDGTSWIDQGDIMNIDWSAIENKPTSSVADIDDAVSKKHTQNTDTELTNPTMFSSYKPTIKSPDLKAPIEYNGKFYIGCESGYVLEYDGTTWSYSKPGSEHITDGTVFNGILYFSCRAGYVLEYNGVSWTYIQRETNGKNINTFLEYNGKLYGGCDQGWVLEFDGANWTSALRIASEKGLDAIAVYNGKLYNAGVKGKFAIYDGANWTEETHFGDRVFTGLVSNGILYFACAKGKLLQFDGTNWTQSVENSYGEDMQVIYYLDSSIYLADDVGHLLKYSGVGDTELVYTQPSNKRTRSMGSFDDIMYIGCDDGYLIRHALSFQIESSNIVTKNSVDGTFTTVDGKTITVVDGQITSIV